MKNGQKDTDLKNICKVYNENLRLILFSLIVSNFIVIVLSAVLRFGPRFGEEALLYTVGQVAGVSLWLYPTSWAVSANVGRSSIGTNTLFLSMLLIGYSIYAFILFLNILT